MKTLLNCLVTLMCLVQTCYANEFIKYEKGGFEKAQAQARKEGKKIFLDFYASWCSPCKFMDETTFRDKDVKQLLNKSFVALKVNIDDFDGFDLKTKYDIRFLPSILIFDENGIIIERVEETMSPSKLKLMLNRVVNNGHITPVHQANISPRELVMKATENNYVAAPNETTDRNKLMYRVQIAVFSTFDNAHSKAEKIKETFLDPVTIVQDNGNNNKVKYRVLLGEFTSLDEARSFKEMLKKEFTIEGLVY